MRNRAIPFIDYALCVGCGACAEAFPEVFVIRDGLAWVLDSEGLHMQNLDNMVNICIYGAISIEGPGSSIRSNKAPASRGRSGRRA